MSSLRPSPRDSIRGSNHIFDRSDVRWFAAPRFAAEPAWRVMAWAFLSTAIGSIAVTTHPRAEAVSCARRARFETGSHRTGHLDRRATVVSKRNLDATTFMFHLRAHGLIEP